MPASTSEASKAQPWKANWPPAKQSQTTAGHMVDDSGSLLIDGDCIDYGLVLAEFACSRKETEAKANWPGAENAAKTGRKYMVDDSDALLIDGGDSGPGHCFTELACSRKEAGTK